MESRVETQNKHGETLIIANPIYLKCTQWGLTCLLSTYLLIPVAFIALVIFLMLNPTNTILGSVLTMGPIVLLMGVGSLLICYPNLGAPDNPYLSQIGLAIAVPAYFLLAMANLILQSPLTSLPAPTWLPIASKILSLIATATTVNIVLYAGKRSTRPSTVQLSEVLETIFKAAIGAVLVGIILLFVHQLAASFSFVAGALSLLVVFIIIIVIMFRLVGETRNLHRFQSNLFNSIPPQLKNAIRSLP